MTAEAFLGRLDTAAAEFRDAIARAGLRPPSAIIPDGGIHRFSTNGKPDDDSGWYILFSDGVPAGAFGCWRTGIQQHWSARSDRHMTAAERAVYQRRIEQLQQQRRDEEARRHAEAAEQASALWRLSEPAPVDHPYLVRKGVQPHGLRLYRGDLVIAGQSIDGSLIVPLRDTDGRLCSLEFIAADGDKLFLPGGRKRGASFLLGTIHDVLCIAEGFATAASLYEATGYATAVAFDAGNLKAVAEAYRAAYPTVPLIICGDHDANGVGQAKSQEAAVAVGARIAIPEAPGLDWNDVARRFGIQTVKEGVMRAVKNDPGAQDETRAVAVNGGRPHPAVAGEPPTPQEDGPQQAGPYVVVDGRICRLKPSGQTLAPDPLCNFTARVTEEIALDDGAETTRAFTIEGRLDSGESLPPARVPAAKFAAMNWITDQWGLRAVIRAGNATRDHLREAIQRFSRDAARRHVYQHTGWREIGGQHYYLSGNGAIGQGSLDIEVDLGDDLARYAIPRIPNDPREAMQHSLRLLQVAPLTVTVPLWATVFRAPLASALPTDFSLWIEGATGSMKSTLSALFLSHYGSDFARVNLAQWSSTVNMLERRAFMLKDAPFVIDDWAPGALDQRDLEMKAARLLRAQGNLSGRGRLRSDLTERPAYHPRGIIISTGEQHPPGQSLLARTLLTELSRDDVNLACLTELQRAKGRLAHAMSGYLHWLAPQMPTMPATLRALFQETRERACLNGEHLRVPETLAHCWIGLTFGMTYAVEVGAITPAEADALQADSWAALCDLGREQGKLVEDERPTRRFLSVLATLLTTGRVRLSSKTGDDMGDGRLPELVGWVDSDWLYLIPEATYRAVSIFCRESGQPFATSLDRVKRDLTKEGLTEHEEGRLTALVRIGSRVHRILKVSRTETERLIGQPVPDVTTVTTVTGYEE